MKAKPDWIENAKEKAALEAIKQVKDGFAVGLGSGTTAAHVIEVLGKRIQTEKLRVLGVPTSYQAFALAVKNRIPITTLDEHPSLDLAIDGADQIDDDLNLIKGMGGALAREKIVASACKRLIIIADETKKVKALGENDHPVPLEALPFAASLVMRKIRELAGRPAIREGTKKAGPVITDNGNMLIDASFGTIRDPMMLEQTLKGLTGIVETGLFIQMASTVYIGKPSGVVKLERKNH